MGMDDTHMVLDEWVLLFCSTLMEAIMNKRRKRFRLKNSSLKEICKKYPYKVVGVSSRSNDTVLQLDNLRIVYSKK